PLRKFWMVPASACSLTSFALIESYFSRSDAAMNCQSKKRYLEEFTVNSLLSIGTFLFCCPYVGWRIGSQIGALANFYFAKSPSASAPAPFPPPSSPPVPPTAHPPLPVTPRQTPDPAGIPRQSNRGPSPAAAVSAPPEASPAVWPAQTRNSPNPRGSRGSPH